MLRSTKLVTVLTAAGLGFGIYFAPTAPTTAVAVAAESFTPLCNSVAEACEYSGPNAPVLREDVCWDGSMATLKVGDCPTDSRPYSVTYGEVADPTTLEIIAYQPLPNACDLGYCLPAPGPIIVEVAGFLCCDPHGNCTVLEGKYCPMGDLVYCFNYTQNEEGEGVTCHDDED